MNSEAGTGAKGRPGRRRGGASGGVLPLAFTGAWPATVGLGLQDRERTCHHGFSPLPFAVTRQGNHRKPRQCHFPCPRAWLCLTCFLPDCKSLPDKTSETQALLKELTAGTVTHPQLCSVHPWEEGGTLLVQAVPTSPRSGLRFWEDLVPPSAFASDGGAIRVNSLPVPGTGPA